MTIREEIEQREQRELSPYACLSTQTKGREYPAEACPIRTCFQRDIDRIVHCKAFRRLKHKTPESGSSTRYCPGALSTMSSPSGWWSTWRMTARA